MPACRAAPSPDAATGAGKYLAAPSRSPPRSRAGRNVAGGLSRRILQQMASRIRCAATAARPLRMKISWRSGHFGRVFNYTGENRIAPVSGEPLARRSGPRDGATPGSARGAATRLGGQRFILWRSQMDKILIVEDVEAVADSQLSL